MVPREDATRTDYRDQHDTLKQDSTPAYDVEIDVPAPTDPLLPAFGSLRAPPISTVKSLNRRALFGVALTLVILAAAWAHTASFDTFKGVTPTAVPKSSDDAWRVDASANPSGDRTASESVSGQSAVTAWLSNPATVNRGVIPFSPVDFIPVIPDQALQSTPWSNLDQTCLDAWVSRSELCTALEDLWRKETPLFDVVWTWINGSTSEEKMSAWRTFTSDGSSSSRVKGVKRTGTVVLNKFRKLIAGAARITHFREHDELRYSMRSVLAAFPPSSLRTLHLVVGDTPSCLPEMTGECESRHEAQIPHWLILDTVQFGSKSGGRVADMQDDGPVLQIHPHSEIFRAPLIDAEAPLLNQDWRSRVVPSFNSLAIESQLMNIDCLSSVTLNLNDDFSLLRPMTSSDVYSPLTGPVFRLQREMFVLGVAPWENKADPDGEWKGLQYTNWLLDQRFGVRRRPYVAHQARTVATAIWREVQKLFARELTLTAEARFRGEKPEEIQEWFLLVHYTIEKHREALLWSFFYGRSDVDQDGLLDRTERSLLLEALAGMARFDSIISVVEPQRDTMHDFDSTYTYTGSPSPQSTRMEFSSNDGYAHFEAEATYRRKVPWPSFDVKDAAGEERRQVCTINVDACFGDDWVQQRGNVSIESVFKRVAFERPACGDCMIAALLGTESRGLEAFLPPPSSSSVSQSEATPVEAVGLSPTYHGAFDLPLATDVRARCVNLIQRYSYVIGTSPAVFAAVRGPQSLKHTLSKLKDPADRPAFLALNDDMRYAASGIDDVFKEWFEDVLPNPSPWEKA